MLNIRFHGTDYVLVGDSLEEGGAIATVETYVHGHVSYAHLFPDGQILRFQQPIGTKADIDVLGPAEEPEVADDFGVNMWTALLKWKW